jgi:hypothetical protein
MEREDHEGLSEELEQEADELERKADEVGDQIEGVRRDWEAKKADPSVPGARKDDEDASPPPPEADIAPGDRAS